MVKSIWEYVDRDSLLSSMIQLLWNNIDGVWYNRFIMIRLLGTYFGKEACTSILSFYSAFLGTIALGQFILLWTLA